VFLNGKGLLICEAEPFEFEGPLPGLGLGRRVEGVVCVCLDEFLCCYFSFRVKKGEGECLCHKVVCLVQENGCGADWLDGKEACLAELEL